MPENKYKKNYIIFIIFIISIELVSFNIFHLFSKGYKNKYSKSIRLIMSKKFDDCQLSGKNVTVGVVDVGFGNFKTNNFTKGLTVINYKDFIDDDTSSFFINDDDHGTLVIKNIGGKYGDTIYGLAYNSMYYLAKTDVTDKEPKEDEYRLIKAINWLINERVDVINISLGYTVFDNDKTYTTKILTGKSSICSKFIDSCLATNPNLIIVVSAGNEGTNFWKYITFPSDVRDAITVGACDINGNKRLRYSGVGPLENNYIKPDLVVYPTMPGNSFTSPIVTGLCAALLEYKKITRNNLIEIIKSSSSNFQNPNTEIGFGMPQTKLIIQKIK